MAAAGAFGTPGEAGWPRPRTAPSETALAVPLTVRGQQARAALTARGVETAGDLLAMRPRTWRDYREGVDEIADAHVGAIVTLRGEVVRVEQRPTRRRGFTIVKATVKDGTGFASLVWFNQRWLARTLGEGAVVQARGEARLASGMLEVAVREHEILSDGGEAIHTEGLVAVYDATRALSSRTIHALVHEHLHRADTLPEPLPAWLRCARRLPPRRDAIAALHRPLDPGEPERARRALAYGELVLLQLGLLARRDALDAAGGGVPLGPPGELARQFRDSLPWSLTLGQSRAIRDVDRDLARSRPMRRLLLGDVGSGKTVVAVHALLRALEHGGQGALMAPTDVLAKQHAETVRGLVAPLGLEVDLLVGDLPARDRRARLQRIASGDAVLAVGTHALIEKGVEFQRLLVAVVDEQHRFGVEQRAALADRGGVHALHMTATPIPRSFALALYGDLDVTELTDRPPGREPVRTRVVSPLRRADCYAWLVRQWEEHGRQAFVVCPRVEGSETEAARAATDEHARLQKELAPLSVGLIHGRLRGADKAEAMRAFTAAETQVLVATTVIEVGVDIPNATAVVIEDADRFGLAQLHQIRGRVGRGGGESWCFLFESAEPTDVGRQRLQALVEHESGFLLAERDLHLRGEGELAGTRQAGRSDLRYASLRDDRRLVAKARADARHLLRRGLRDEVLVRAVEERFGDLLDRIGRA